MGNLARIGEKHGPQIQEKELDEGARRILVRKLLSLREEIVRSGVPLLDWDDLEREVAERRGERDR